MASTSKFTAKQFTKYGFTHLKEEDFNDDGARFQVWMHEGTGLKVTYSRGNWSGEVEYFISVRTWDLGMEYADYSKLDHYKACDEFNGCYEVDMDKLVETLYAFNAELIEARRVIENEELDMSGVMDRVETERKCIKQILKMVKGGCVEWWNLGEYDLKNAARNVKSLEKEAAKLDEIIENGFGDKAAQRKAWNTFNEYGYVVDKCDEDRKYSSYAELYKLAMSE